MMSYTELKTAIIDFFVVKVTRENSYEGTKQEELLVPCGRRAADYLINEEDLVKDKKTTTHLLDSSLTTVKGGKTKLLEEDLSAVVAEISFSIALDHVKSSIQVDGEITWKYRYISYSSEHLDLQLIGCIPSYIEDRKEVNILNVVKR